VLKWRADRKEGQEVTADDIQVVDISREQAQKIVGVVKSTPEDRALVIGGQLKRDVTRSDFVRFSDVLENRGDVPSQRIKMGGFRAFPLRVDPQRTVGDLLRVGDHIDIIGLVSVGGKPAKAYTLISNVRVLAVGGRSETPEERSRVRGRTSQNLRVYRTLTIELKLTTCEQMAELLPRVRGKIWVVVRNPNEKANPNVDGKINPQLLPVLEEPLPEGSDYD
jgi:Flp pilus assembly protein CpaB